MASAPKRQHWLNTQAKRAPLGVEGGATLDASLGASSSSSPHHLPTAYRRVPPAYLAPSLAAVLPRTLPSLAVPVVSPNGSLTPTALSITALSALPTVTPPSFTENSPHGDKSLPKALQTRDGLAAAQSYDPYDLVWSRGRFF